MPWIEKTEPLTSEEVSYIRRLFTMARVQFTISRLVRTWPKGRRVNELVPLTKVEIDCCRP
jgi:hypothetical protein